MPRDLVLGGVLLAALFYLPQPTPNVNEVTRAYLTMALVDDRALSVDGPVERYGALPVDLARVGGRYYSDKAPGAAFALAIPYGAYRLFADAPGTRDDAVMLLRAMGWIPLCLIGYALLWRAATSLIADQRRRTGWLVVCIAGTPLYPYSVLMFGHAATALCIVGGYLCLSRGDATSTRRILAGGGLLGLAVVFDYIAAPVAGVLGIAGLASLWRVRKGADRWRHVIMLAVAAAAPVAILMLYHTFAFGGPLTTGYSFEVHSWHVDLHEGGLGGLAAPQPAVVGALLCGLARGVFFLSPMLLAAIPGCLLEYRRSRLWGGALGAAIVVHILFLSGFENWNGSWAAGPRYMLPVYLLLAVGVARWLESAHEREQNFRLAVFAAAGLVSVGIFALALIVFPHWPTFYPNPLADFLLPFTAGGIFAPTRLTGGAPPDAAGPVFLILLSAAAYGYCVYALVPGLRTRLASVGGGLALASLWIAVVGAFPTPRTADWYYSRGTVLRRLYAPEKALAAFRSAYVRAQSESIREPLRRQIQELETELGVSEE